MKKSKKILKAFEIILQIILILVIIINLLSIISVKLMKNSYPKVFGYSYFSVISGSMEPTIDVGDEVIVKLTQDVKEDDIVTYSEDGVFVTHRIVKLDGEDIITKGDNNDSVDNPKKIYSVIGKVVLIIPLLGKIKYIITNKYFVICLIAAYIIYSIVVNKSDEEEELKEE